MLHPTDVAQNSPPSSPLSPSPLYFSGAQPRFVFPNEYETIKVFSPTKNGKAREARSENFSAIYKYFMQLFILLIICAFNVAQSPATWHAIKSVLRRWLVGPSSSWLLANWGIKFKPFKSAKWGGFPASKNISKPKGLKSPSCKCVKKYKKDNGRSHWKLDKSDLRCKRFVDKVFQQNSTRR